MKIDMFLLILASLGFLLSFASLVAYFVNEEKDGALIDTLFACGWLTSMALFVYNWYDVGEPPFGNMYHVAVVTACCFYPFWKFLKEKHKQASLAPFFLLAQMVLLGKAIAMWSPDEWVRPPALQSVYFVPHVLSYMMAYALATVAFMAVFSAVLRSNIDKKLRVGIYLVVPLMLFLTSYALGFTHSSIIWCSAALVAFVIFSSLSRIEKFRLASVSSYDEAAYRVLLLSYTLLTIGLCLGALWAEEAWGQYWSWDRKEIWSLITWMLYAIYFHCRKTLFFRKCSRPVHLLAFLALVITFLAVNLMSKMGSSLHSYTN